LHQTPDGQVHRNAHLKPMQHAQRIEGGVGSLVSALAQELPAKCLQLNTLLQAVSSTDSGARAALKSDQGEEELEVKTVALAIPPRLLSSINFQPAVSQALSGSIADTPTWMAAQAKFFAIYRQPFWRQAGFSGDAFSSTEVLAEIHDASAAQLSGLMSEDEGTYSALFGFVRLDAEERAELGSQAVCDLAIQQLTGLFGEEASRPVEILLQDWSAEPFTASRDDRQALSQHPLYHPAPAAGYAWAERLHLIAAETSAQSGGLIEGALQRGAEFAQLCGRLP
jgi:monoamine oxidase